MSKFEDHSASVAAASCVLQAALPGASVATQKAAHITYYKAVLASGRAQGISTGALAALASLGVFDGGKAGDS